MVETAAIASVSSGRGVLQGAFALLDVLSHADNGLGVTELARKTGFAKTTVYRLAEQLVEVGAAQRVEYRYFVGPTIGRLGRCWQPDPQLRQAAYEPVRDLAAQAQTAAAVYVMHERRAHLVTAAVSRGQSWLPPSDLDAESLPRTPVARVLLAPASSKTTAVIAEPRRLRSDLRDWRRIVIDEQDAADGIRWVAAPIWRSEERCVAAIATLVVAPIVAPGLKDLVMRAARQIGQRLE